MKPLIVLLALLATPAVAAESETFVIVNPSGRGNQGMAEGFLRDFSAALRASWPEGAPAPAFEGRYHVTEADALASIRRSRPAFAIVSPGFYLAHRKDLGLVPLLQPVRAGSGAGVVHVIARGGAPPVPLARMRLGGQLAGEPAWVAGPVLGLPAGSRPTFVPAARVLESVRQLQRGEVDGVLLADADWHLLKATGKSAGLAVIFTSPPLPEGPVVSFGEPNDTARAAAAALSAWKGSEPGRKVLERMTLKDFRPASATDYASLAASHDQAREELSR